MNYYAHTQKNPDGTPAPKEKWEPLFTGAGNGHLEEVATLAATFAEPFLAGDWGNVLGLYHDVGKFSQEFQAYLDTASDPHTGETSGKVDHSTAGAKYLASRLGVPGHILAYCVAGHHSGLLDGKSASKSCQKARLEKEICAWQSALEDQGGFPELLPIAFPETMVGEEFPLGFFTRMLFSCLVDADFLATEAFMSPDKSEQRPERVPDLLPRILHALEGHIAAFGTPKTDINKRRAEIRRACVKASGLDPGLFSLTVPTGGGKTLSSLEFGLRHAIAHGQQRIIYVIPFTSIIEQNADVFREVCASLSKELGVEVVLEHHSNLDPEKETTRSRLATENWDAPIIVTTNVQFYESLFAAKTSRCRKLHNIANAVVILDEAQSLPVDFLSPCLAALRELTARYSSSVVLCTATQPAIGKSADFPIGLDQVREIIPDPVHLSRSLKRTCLTVHPETLHDQELAEALLDEDRVLCIVNTRNHAQAVYQSIGSSEHHYHLSALMCPAHRSETLNHIKELPGDTPCRLVATNLIEAGVDISFPVVYRSLAGLEAIIQAAGRCNRNAETDVGEVIVFPSEHQDREAFLRETAQVASQIFALYPEDAMSLEAIRDYFRLYYWEQSNRWDKKNILSQYIFDRRNPEFPFDFRFKTVADDFRLIESTYQPIIIPWREEGRKLTESVVERAPFQPPSRSLFRQLQRYTVQIPRGLFQEHKHRFYHIEEYDLYIAGDDVDYSEDIGLNLSIDSFLNA